MGRLCMRTLLCFAAAALTLAFAGAASAATYVVLYKSAGVPANGGVKIRAAGGTVVASYTIADFSLGGLQAITRDDIDDRWHQYKQAMSF